MAAVGSYLFARSSGGRWLVRMEDLDTPRLVPGSAEEILRTLERYSLEWDGEVVRQSDRLALYEDALDSLRRQGRVYPCACSRAELARASSAPSEPDPIEHAAPVYPGTCRSGAAPGRRPRATRFRVEAGEVRFEDAVFGSFVEESSTAVGDFVVQRADGPFAYQLAVVVDDAEQGITQVVRGADLLGSTARQILLQRALGLPKPAYAHLPLVRNQEGRKLGKSDGALALETLSEEEIGRSLRHALEILGQTPVSGSAREILAEARIHFRPEAIPI